jgi:hypothetical protein
MNKTATINPPMNAVLDALTARGLKPIESTADGTLTAGCPVCRMPAALTIEDDQKQGTVVWCHVKNCDQTDILTMLGLAGWSRPQSLADVCKAEYPEPRWVIPNLYPEGLTLLCGKPKVGKSWQCLDLGLAVAVGGCALGNIEVEQGDVLYLSLEDSPRRLKNRAVQLLGPNDVVPSNFDIKFDAPPLGDGLEEMVDEWIEAHPDARIVMIDTLARVRPNGGSRKDWYLEDTAQLIPLQRLAMKRGLMILAVSHLRKMASEDPLDMVSGSVGLTGVADTIAILTRGRGKADGELFVTGRDIKEQELAMSLQGMRWVLEGDAEEFRLEKNRKQILELLREAGGAMHYSHIADVLDKKEDSIRRTCNRMVKAGQIARADAGHFEAAPNTPVPTVPTVPNNSIGTPGTPGTAGATETPGTGLEQKAPLPHDPNKLPDDLRARYDELCVAGDSHSMAMQLLAMETGRRYSAPESE